MQFKHPTFLYYLLLLIIPILVHLFQLRKFKKEAFTNVAFLQQLVIKNRKSSQLKKWLLLCCRMVLITAVVLAFAQPYFSNSTSQKNEHTFIYLDNSISLNANGNKGNLLQTTAQEIIENVQENSSYSLLTNSNFYRNLSSSELKSILKKTRSTSKILPIEEVLLRISSQKEATNHLVISDFQNVISKDFETNNRPLQIVQVQPELKSNVSLDSVFIEQHSSNSLTVHASIRNQGAAKENIPIALYNDQQLLSKQTFSISENTQKTIEFSVEKKTPFKGKIEINLQDTYSFDNVFYFSLNANEKINVMCIGEANNYLARIFTKDEFNFSSYSLQNTNYNSIGKQNLIILNELENIATPLLNALISYAKKGGNMVLIPNKETDIQSYNQLIKNLNLGSITAPQKDSLKITSIQYEHPIFTNVFEKKVTNFQYPVVTQFFPNKLKNKSRLLTLENNQPFVSQLKTANSKVYWFSSPISKSNSNFTNSPLIVPLFYSIGQESLQLSELFYRLNEINKIEVPVLLEKDQILSISNSETSFIPLQQSFQNKVQLTTKEQPETSGFYSINTKDTSIQTIAFNHKKTESNLQFTDFKSAAFEDSKIDVNFTTLEALKKITEKNKVHWLWKWFLGLAIVSLLLEILILKYFKA